MSLGLIVAYSSLKSWLKWKQYKRDQSGGDGKLVGELKCLQTVESQKPKLLSQADPHDLRRSQRVVLQVAVLIKAQMPEGKRLQAYAFTVDVNSHGGLLECSFRMPVGQKIILMNPQSGREVGCRVERVHGLSADSFTTAFEFEQRSPWFWPITFLPEDWGGTEEVTNDHR